MNIVELALGQPAMVRSPGPGIRCKIFARSNLRHFRAHAKNLLPALRQIKFLASPVPHLVAHDVMTMFIALAVLLGAAKLAGEIMQKLDQPSVLGEIMAGILLGPTVLGHFKPGLYAFIFPATGNLPIVLETVTTLGVVFFLLIAGLEIDLRSIFRQGKSALLVSFFGVIIPFAFGFGAAGLFPRFLGAAPNADRLIFSLFVGTALSISALPVIAKILMDLDRKS